MNLLSFLDQLGSAPSLTEAAAAPRRQLLRQLGGSGAQLLAAALPLSLALTTAPAAQARPADSALDGVLLLLKLEQLQLAFYTQAVSATALAAFRADLVLLQSQQQDHVTFLQQFLNTAAVLLPTPPTFDFSGRRNNAANPVLFPNVFTNVDSFLQLAQQLEDAGVSIYKSQAAFLTDKPTLAAILRMHSAEARHAAHIRTLRRTYGSSTRVKSWPSRGDSAPAVLIQVPTAPATTPVTTTSIYTFENNETQLASGARLIPFATLLTDTKLVQSNALAEAFDEPLPTTQATALLNIFG